MQKTAILLGATGLLGSVLLNFLLEDETYEKVKIFVRRESKVKHEKLEEVIIKDFEELENYQDLITGDVLFSCLGTILKKAKTKKNYEKIEIKFPTLFAKIAQGNGCQYFVFVSVSKADINSPKLFKQTKAKLEQELQNLELQNLQILRPNFIMGNRNEVRAKEDIWRVLNAAFPMFIPASKKPIPVNTVAKFMQQVAFKTGQGIYEARKIRKIAQRTFDMYHMKEETKYREV